ncbi:MAG: hypothetical protein WD187_01210 [Candidatus Woykebacteria bacterium]
MKFLPKTPHKRLRSPRGQILILFLLVLVVGLAIVLSISSRTVTDIRTTTTSDESNRAYFAAEAGVEEALRQLDFGNTGDLTLDFNDLNQTEANVNVQSGGSIPRFVFPQVIQKDHVAQVVFLETWDDLSSGSWNGELEILWGGGSPPDQPETPAIEVSVIYKSQVGGQWVIQQGGISKTAFDPYAARPTAFNCTIGSGMATISPPQTLEGFDFNFMATLDVSGPNEDCDSLDAGSGEPVLARIKVLYGPSPIAVRPADPNNQLYAQGWQIESSGNTLSGVTRKLDVTRLFPSLSGLFDYVLFNGSSNPLSK